MTQKLASDVHCTLPLIPGLLLLDPAFRGLALPSPAGAASTPPRAAGGRGR